jgi:hypothetical protein
MDPIILVNLAVVGLAVAVPIVLAARGASGAIDAMADLFPTAHATEWPRGVQEQEPFAWRWDGRARPAASAA